MQLEVYVNYRGTCEEAFHYYEQHLGAKIGSMRKHGANPSMPPDWKDKVLHAHMDIGGSALLGADIPNAEPMRSAYVTLILDTEDEAERVYRALSDGGEVFMKMEKTHFANRFAMLRDKFGASWMILQGRG